MLEPIPFAGMVDLDEELFIADQLTDDEIIACMGSLPKYNSKIVDEDLVKFAKAILRKAKEK